MLRRVLNIYTKLQTHDSTCCNMIFSKCWYLWCLSLRLVLCPKDHLMSHTAVPSKCVGWHSLSLQSYLIECFCYSAEKRISHYLFLLTTLQKCQEMSVFYSFTSYKVSWLYLFENVLSSINVLKCVIMSSVNCFHFYTELSIYWQPLNISYRSGRLLAWPCHPNLS